MVSLYYICFSRFTRTKNIINLYRNYVRDWRRIWHLRGFPGNTKKYTRKTTKCTKFPEVNRRGCQRETCPGQIAVPGKKYRLMKNESGFKTVAARTFLVPNLQPFLQKLLLEEFICPRILTIFSLLEYRLYNYTASGEFVGKIVH